MKQLHTPVLGIALKVVNFYQKVYDHEEHSIPDEYATALLDVVEAVHTLAEMYGDETAQAVLGPAKDELTEG